MKNSIDAHIEYSINNLPIITLALDRNIEFIDKTLWTSDKEKQDIFNKVIEIYYKKYYLYKENNYDKIDKYIKSNKNINKKLKNILLAIIDYFEESNNENIILENQNGTLYLTIIIYLSIVLYNINFIKIDEVEKIKTVIDKVITKFSKIKYRKTYNLENLIIEIKEIIQKNNLFFRSINNLMYRGNKNSYINISKDTNYYKVMYEYDIDELDNYDGKDIKIVIKKLNIYSVLSKISFDLAYYTAFKLLINNRDKIILFPIRKEMLKEETLNEYIGDKNKEVLKNIKFLIDFNDIVKDYDFVNFAIKYDLNLCIDVAEEFESDNYNMFMDIKDVVATEGFLSLNDKYMEIWKDTEMNFIVKNMDTKISERDLLKLK